MRGLCEAIQAFLVSKAMTFLIPGLLRTGLAKTVIKNGDNFMFDRRPRGGVKLGIKR